MALKMAGGKRAARCPYRNPACPHPRAVGRGYHEGCMKVARLAQSRRAVNQVEREQLG